MKLFSLALATLFTPIFADKVPWERLEIDKAVLLILDLQVGLYGLVRDFDPTLYQRNLLAHAAIGQIFDIPVILTTSAQNGPNGPLPKEILEMYPDAPLSNVMVKSALGTTSISGMPCVRPTELRL